MSNVKYKTDVADFWRDFARQSRRDQAAKIDPLLTRLSILLTLDYVRHIVGQKETTVDFARIMLENKIVLLRLSANLSEDAKRFLGTILISELLYAARSRPGSRPPQFCIFVDEFQNFATSKDFGVFITEARKYSVATTVAHQERFGQFSEDYKIQGATAAAVNKIFFQVTVRDSQELAPEFAEEPPVETRLEPEYVISQFPLYDLIRGHPNVEIRAFVRKHLRGLQESMEKWRSEMEGQRLQRMDALDEESLHRLDQGIEGADRYFARPAIMSQALKEAERSVERARGSTSSLARLQEETKKLQNMIQQLNNFLTAIMEGRLKPGDKEFYCYIAK